MRTSVLDFSDTGRDDQRHPGAFTSTKTQRKIPPRRLHANRLVDVHDKLKTSRVVSPTSFDTVRRTRHSLLVLLQILRKCVYYFVNNYYLNKHHVKWKSEKSIVE